MNSTQAPCETRWSRNGKHIRIAGRQKFKRTAGYHPFAWRTGICHFHTSNTPRTRPFHHHTERDMSVKSIWQILFTIEKSVDWPLARQTKFPIPDILNSRKRDEEATSLLAKIPWFYWCFATFIWDVHRHDSILCLIKTSLNTYTSYPAKNTWVRHEYKKSVYAKMNWQIILPLDNILQGHCIARIVVNHCPMFSDDHPVKMAMFPEMNAHPIHHSRKSLFHRCKRISRDHRFALHYFLGLPWHLKPIINVLSVTMNAHFCIWHTMVTCRWIASVSTRYLAWKIWWISRKMADAIPWRGIDHINGTVFLPTLQSSTNGRTNTVWISRSPILGNTRTLYSLSCTLPAAEISSTQSSLSGLWKNLREGSLIVKVIRWFKSESIG